MKNKSKRSDSRPSDRSSREGIDSSTSEESSTQSGGRDNSVPETPRPPDSQQAGSSPQVLMAEFRLEAPSASNVRLVGEFTDWEQSPLDLIADEDGVWQVTVALTPGRYAYRYLVDGQWADDPNCSECEINSYGTTNAVKQVG